jgi:hypothetical protein
LIFFVTLPEITSVTDMRIHPFFSVFGIGGGELIIVFICLLVPFVMLVAVVALVSWLVRRRPSPPPPIPNHERRCPRCGANLSIGAPEGLCPKCLMRAGFESQAPPPVGVSQVPSSQEVAAALPQLKSWKCWGAAGWAWFTRLGKGSWTVSSP